MRSHEYIQDANSLLLFGWKTLRPDLAAQGLACLDLSLGYRSTQSLTSVEVQTMDRAMEEVFVHRVCPWEIRYSSDSGLYVCPVIDQNLEGINAAIKFNAYGLPSDSPIKDIWQPIATYQSTRPSPLPGYMYTQESPKDLPQPGKVFSIYDHSTARLWSCGISLAKVAPGLNNSYQWWEYSSDQLFNNPKSKAGVNVRNSYELDKQLEYLGLCNADETGATVFPQWLCTLSQALRFRLNYHLPTLSAQGLVPLDRKIS